MNVLDIFWGTEMDGGYYRSTSSCFQHAVGIVGIVYTYHEI